VKFFREERGPGRLVLVTMKFGRDLVDVGILTEPKLTGGTVAFNSNAEEPFEVSE